MPIPSAFGAVYALGPEDLSVLDARIARASRAAANLRAAVDTWRASTTFTTHVAVQEPERTSFDFFIEVSKPYPHDKWAMEASDLAHNARSALDNFNDRIFRKYATKEYDAKKIQFPITLTGKEWRNWKRSHDALPAWLIERYRQIQPQSGPYIGLKGLAMLNNQDKHVWLQKVSIAITELVGSSTLTIEGIDPDIRLDPIAREIFLERGMRRLHFATAIGNRKILDAPSTADNDIQPVLHFHVGSEEATEEGSFTMDELAELPKRVAYALNFVNGDDRALVCYQAVPPFASQMHELTRR